MDYYYSAFFTITYIYAILLPRFRYKIIIFCLFDRIDAVLFGIFLKCYPYGRGDRGTGYYFAAPTHPDFIRYLLPSVVTKTIGIYLARLVVRV